MSIVTSDTSITHTFGNVACVAMDYIKGYFTPNFFQTEHISTRIAYKQLDIFRSNREFWKNKKPVIILTPRVEIDDSSVAGYGSAQFSRITNSRSPVEFSDLHDVILDRAHGVQLRFAWNRIKVNYDVAIVVQTYNEQINLANTLKNRLVPPKPDYIHTTLEACIPKGIIRPISQHLGFKLNDPDITAGTVHYLNTHGVVPFTYKLKNASGTNEYFMLYDTNIEMIPSDITTDAGDSIGVVNDSYTIGLTMSFEFNTVGTWYVHLADANLNFITNPSDAEIDSISQYKDEDAIVPLYSIPLRYNLRLGDGWKILQSPTYAVTEEGMGEKHLDITDIGQIIPTPIQNTLRALVDHNRKHAIPLDPYIRFKCFKDHRELPYGKEGFEVDLEKFKIYTYDCTPRRTYRLFIMVNNVMINSISPEVNKHMGYVRPEK